MQWARVPYLSEPIGRCLHVKRKSGGLIFCLLSACLHACFGLLQRPGLYAIWGVNKALQRQVQSHTWYRACNTRAPRRGPSLQTCRTPTGSPNPPSRVSGRAVVRHRGCQLIQRCPRKGGNGPARQRASRWARYIGAVHAMRSAVHRLNEARWFVLSAGATPAS